MNEATLVPSAELAARAHAHHPNESTAYRTARTSLLTEEIELRRHIARVAAMRRGPPPGGEVPTDYEFDGANGPVGMSELIGDKDTLIIYSFMYGSDREQGCPMCTAQMSAWDDNARHIEQRAAFAMVARSPIERILQWGTQSGWRNLALFSDPSGG